jgi:hypothetical protein
VLSVEGRKLEEVRWIDLSRVFVNSDIQGSADLRDNGHARQINIWQPLSTSLSWKVLEGGGQRPLRIDPASREIGRPGAN